MPLIITRLQPLAAALILVLAPAALLAAPAADKAKNESAAEKTRKALDQKIDLDIAEQPMVNAINQLKELTKINFVVDNVTLAQNGIDVNSTPITVKQQGVKARAALRAILGEQHLGYAIIGESVIITTEDMAIHRQLKQKVNLDLDKVPFETAIKDLAKETAVQVLLDKKVNKEAQTPVSLQLEDVPLETAVRLFCEQAELKPVRMGTILYVTSSAKAKELRSEPDLAPSQYPQGVPPDNMINVAPGVLGGGVGGLGGLVPAIKNIVVPADAPLPPPEEKKEEKKDDKKDDKKEPDKKEDK